MATKFEAWKASLAIGDLFLNGKNNDPETSGLNCAICPARNGWNPCQPSCFEHFSNWAASSSEDSQV